MALEQKHFLLSNNFFSWFPNIECLLKLQELQGSVIECCSCKLRTLLPPNGIDGLDKNMDLLKVVLQSEEEEQKLCNFCIQKVYPSKPATFYCSECDVLMCGSCSDVIHSQLEFRCHDITRASTVKDGTPTGEIQRSKVSSPRSSSCSTLSTKRSSSVKPRLSSRPSSGLLDYSAIPGNYNNYIKYNLKLFAIRSLGLEKSAVQLSRISKFFCQASNFSCSLGWWVSSQASCQPTKSSKKRTWFYLLGRYYVN